MSRMPLRLRWAFFLGTLQATWYLWRNPDKRRAIRRWQQEEERKRKQG